MIYFVDTENVGGHRFRIGSNDKIYYLVGNREIYDSNNKNKGVYKLGNNEFYIITKHNGRKNALDFILDSVLGNMLGIYGKDELYCIISNDKDFNIICDFWRTYGYDILQLKDYDISDDWISGNSFLAPDITNRDRIESQLKSLNKYLGDILYNICLNLYKNKDMPFKVFRHILFKSIPNNLSHAHYMIRNGDEVCYYLYREVLDKW